MPFSALSSSRLGCSLRAVAGMNSHHHESQREPSGRPPSSSMRKTLEMGARSIALGCAVCLANALWQTRGQKDAPATESDSNFPSPQTIAPDNSASPPSLEAKPALREAVASELPQPVVLSEPTPETRQLVSSLVYWQSTGALNQTEQVTGWKGRLKELVQQGALAVPAIQEFLAKNTDYDFGQTSADALGYPSARAALIDALTQIGGPDAVAALTVVLRTAADPREIAALAQDLEKLEPSQHRQEALEAARQTLEMAGARKLETGDVAPLFEVLQKYGGSDVVADFEKASGQWSYYATISVGLVPSGLGISSPVPLAPDP